jgi:flotillin
MPIVDLLGGGVFAATAVIVIVVLLVFFVARRYKIAGPNEALIIAGASGSRIRQQDGTVVAAEDRGVRVVVGAGAVVLPIVHKDERLKLQSYKKDIELTDAVTTQGIRVRIKGTAVFKIGRQPDQIRKAAERFLKQEEAIAETVEEVLKGSLRGIVGQLTIDELITQREAFVKRVTDEANEPLSRLGLDLDVLNVQEITDEGFSGQLSYIEQLGKRNYQDARRQAEVAEAEAQQQIIAAQRERDLAAAEALARTEAAAARAAQSGPLAQAEAAREVTRRQTELAELEAQRREKELLASTVKLAAAEAQAAIERANGERAARIAVAEAEAARVRIEGQAVADAIAARGEAEAEALALRAEAYRAFNAAALVSTVLERLPEVVAAAAEPMGNIDNLTVLSTDGASDIVRTTTGTVTQASEVLRGLTGVDVRELFAKALVGDDDRPPGDLAGRLRARRDERRADLPTGPATADGGLGAAPRGTSEPTATGEAGGEPTLTVVQPEGEAQGPDTEGGAWEPAYDAGVRGGGTVRGLLAAADAASLPEALADRPVGELMRSRRTPAALRRAYEALPAGVRSTIDDLSLSQVRERYGR